MRMEFHHTRMDFIISVRSYVLLVAPSAPSPAKLGTGFSLDVPLEFPVSLNSSRHFLRFQSRSLDTQYLLVHLVFDIHYCIKLRHSSQLTAFNAVF